MATAVKQKKTFKESMKETGTKVKDYGKKKYEQAKTSAKKYGSDVRSAYDVGYARGWDDAYNIPKRFGATTSAAYGYRKGVKNRRKADKYTNQYNRGGKK
ncbi:MAG: hypothetical protein IJB34_01350 [Clostridia bacterium]|nr:hypothetical protein [Clostridia bacterium]